MQLTSIHILLAITLILMGSPNVSYQVQDRVSEEVSIDLLTLKPDLGLIYKSGMPFTGTTVAFYNNGQVAEKINYLEGKRNGHLFKWFEDGTLSYEANYVSNKLHGSSKSWWTNGNLRSESHFLNGKLNGVQKQWYTTGSLFKVLNMNNGKEDGLQRAWRKNGKIYINYEAKNGRIFGLKRSNLCYELNNENIVSND